MSTRWIPAALGVALIAGERPATDYTRERSVRLVTEASMEMETVSFEMERDGEPVESPFGGGGGGGYEETRRIVEVDRVLEHEQGRPVVVRRTYETIEGEGYREFGGSGEEIARDCPLSGVTLEIAAEGDGEARADVVEGDSPDDPALLEGHRTTLFLDVLLPDEDAEPGDSWDLGRRAILRALRMDLEHALFPREEPDWGGGGDRGGRGGRGGGQSSVGLLRAAEWSGTATWTEETEEHGGEECAVIEIELEASGEIDQPESGFRRRGRMPAVPGTRAARGNDYTVELEGRLLFSPSGRLPVLLEIEGDMSLSMRIERSRGDMTMTISIEREGTYSLLVEAEDLDEEESQ